MGPLGLRRWAHELMQVCIQGICYAFLHWEISWVLDTGDMGRVLHILGGRNLWGAFATGYRDRVNTR